jgi:hypothetical protein
MFDQYSALSRCATGSGGHRGNDLIVSKHGRGTFGGLYFVGFGVLKY